MPGPAAAFIDDRQVRRIQKEQMKCFMADTAVKETAKADAVETCLCFFRTALIQLYTVGIAVISLGQLAQSLTAAAAWIEEVRGNAVRKPDRSQHQRDIVRIGRVIAQLDVVHTQK